MAHAVRLALFLKTARASDSDETIEKAAKIADALALLFGVAVIVGVAAEDLLSRMGLTGLGNWPGASVALGVAGEIAFARRGSKLSGVVSDRLKRRLADAEIEAGRANERAAEANQRAQEAMLEVARLGAKTADVMLAHFSGARDDAMAFESNRTFSQTIAIAQGLMTRDSASEATRVIYVASSLEPFAGTKFDAAVTSISPLLGHFREMLKSTLRNAGWIEIEQSDPTEIELLSMEKTHGPALVQIDVDASQAELLSAAEALASALDAEGIAAIVITNTDTNADVIHIRVGPKPSAPIVPTSDGSPNA